MMKAPSCSALAKNGRNFGSDSSWPSTLVRISTPFSFSSPMTYSSSRTASSGSCSVTTPRPTNRSGLRAQSSSFCSVAHAGAADPFRLARAVFDDAFMGEPVGRFRYFRIDRIVTLARRRGHDLDVDAHPVEVGQPAIDRGHDLGDILFLLCVDFPGGGIGEMRQRDAAEIDMRLRELGGLWNHDVRVDIDRHR